MIQKRQGFFEGDQGFSMTRLTSFILTCGGLIIAIVALALDRTNPDITYMISAILFAATGAKVGDKFASSTKNKGDK